MPYNRARKTTARLFLSPLENPNASIEVLEPIKIIDLIPPQAVQRFDEGGGIVRVGGNLVPRELWSFVTVKPKADLLVDFVYVPRGKKSFLLMAAVALVAVTAFIATGGVALLFGLGATSTFAAGGLGASLLASGVGIAGSLALQALSAPPKASNQGEEKQLGQAGISGNTVTPLDTLPVIFGKIGTSPPMLAPPHTYWDGDDTYARGVVGVQGRCAITDIKINGIPISDFSGAVYETREGSDGYDTARTMFTQTVVEEHDGVVLTNFKTELESTKNDLLTDQTTPDESSPKWHPFRTAGLWDEIVLRFAFPSGIAYTPSGVEAIVPVRIRMRKVGSSTWRNLPTFHIYDKDKGSGPMRCEVRIERIKQPAGKHYSDAFGEFPIVDVCNITGVNEPFEFVSDSYFGPESTELATQSGIYMANALPIFTGYTNGQYTLSASSENTTSTRAWHAADGLGFNPATAWRAAYPTNTFPHWWKVDVGSGNTKTYRSYTIAAGSFSPTAVSIYCPTKWYVQGSNDNTNWTNLDDSEMDVSDDLKVVGIYQIQNPGAYRYYRLLFTDNQQGGGANPVVGATQDLQVAYISFHEYDAPGTTLVGNDRSATTIVGVMSSFGSYAYGRCRYVSLDKKGARVFLDPDQWEAGEYEVQVKRGVALLYTDYDSYAGPSTTTPYQYNGSAVNADFFDYRLTSGSYQIFIGQKNYRSDMQVEAFQTISNESPFDDTGIAMIAVSVPNIQIQSLYAVFQRYAPIWNGTIWNPTEVLTQNPAAFYRQLLLGGANMKPVPGECVDDVGLAEWYERCDANSWWVNAIMSGSRVGEAKQMLASVGYATPRDADMYGVVEDYDTSAETYRYLITPMNTKDEGNANEVPDLPHAIRAEFANEDESFAVDHATVYLDGYDASNAKLFETINYLGITNATQVAARALFDLRQKLFRTAIYTRRVGIEGIGIRRGMVVGLADDTVDGNTAAGKIVSIQTSGSNVTSITLDSIMPWDVKSDFLAVEDITSVSDVLNTSEPMGVAIRIPGSNALIKQVSDVTKSNVCTFTTPFALAGSGLAEGQLVVAGRFAKIVRRCKVLHIIPKGFEERLLLLVDEAPEIFA